MKMLKSRTGQGMLEYILIAAAVVALAVLLVRTLNTKATNKIETLGEQLK